MFVHYIHVSVTQKSYLKTQITTDQKKSREQGLIVAALLQSLIQDSVLRSG